MGFDPPARAKGRWGGAGKKAAGAAPKPPPPEDIKPTTTYASVSKPAPTAAARPTGPGAVWWVRSDLRLTDNAALGACVDHGSHVVPVFLWDNHWRPRWNPEGCAALFLKETLRALDQDLQTRHKSRVVMRRAEGDAPAEVFGGHEDFGDVQMRAHAARLAQSLAVVCCEANCDVVHYCREYHPDDWRRDELVEMELRENFGIRAVAHAGHLLYEPQGMVDNGRPAHVFTLTPYYDRAQKLPPPPRPRPAPAPGSLWPPVEWPASLTVDSGLGLAMDGLQPGRETCRRCKEARVDLCRRHWALPILGEWDCSEKGGLHLVSEFAKVTGGLALYEKARSRADLPNATSRLSPYLRFGVVSPRSLHYALRDAALPAEAKQVMSRRLFWRDLAYFQHWCFPQMSTRSVRPHHDLQEWTSGAEGKQFLKAWTTGYTGYPMVDAAMREMAQTGWMNQAVRIIAAGFLTEFLNLPWQDGHKWFNDQLIDADAPINAMMWQNAGRAGVDQWNFVVDPEAGSQDPTGEYVKRWVPEVARLRAFGVDVMHRPWTATPSQLKAAGIDLGATYPNRIITDLPAAREKTVRAMHRMLLQHPEWRTGSGHDVIMLATGQYVRAHTRPEFRFIRDDGTLTPLEQRDRPVDEAVEEAIIEIHDVLADAPRQKNADLMVTSRVEKVVRKNKWHEQAMYDKLERMPKQAPAPIAAGGDRRRRWN